MLYGWFISKLFNTHAHTNSNGQLISVGDRIRLPDDVTIGYIIEHMLNKKLTVIEEFHSHLEPMAMLEKNSLKNQVYFNVVVFYFKFTIL